LFAKNLFFNIMEKLDIDKFFIFFKNLPIGCSCFSFLNRKIAGLKNCRVPRI
jgi:hypothetical protein